MASDTPSTHILVVDDEDTLRNMLAKMLKRAGYEVTVAGSGREALDQLAAGLSCSIVLLDVRMPDLSGPQLVESLPSKGPLIVFMSGALDEYVSALRASGAAAFIKKPFLSAELLAVLRRVHPEPSAP